MAAAGSSKKAKEKSKSPEDIINGFQELRKQQRYIAAKISEIEMDLKEYDLVIETLNEVEGSRKCFRMIGGVLVERSVKEVLPSLNQNKSQMKAKVQSLKEQLESKGVEINQYREQHNLKIHGEGSGDADSKSVQSDESSKLPTTGVLVT